MAIYILMMINFLYLQLDQNYYERRLLCTDETPDTVGADCRAAAHEYDTCDLYFTSEEGSFKR